MEISETLRRVVVRHAAILLVCAILGAVASFAVSARREAIYSATTRIALGGWDPNDTLKAKTLADSARALATSDGAVRTAIEAAGAQRTTAEVAARISVREVGSSAVVDVGVTDPDRQVAAKLANAVAEAVIETRVHITRGQIEALLDEYDKRVNGLDARIVSLEAAARTAPIGTQRAEVAVQEYAAVIRERAVVDGERRQLRQVGAIQPRAVVLDTATAPTSSEGSSRTLEMTLGIVAGLLAGLALAAMVEVVRPTVIGPEAIARAAGGPWLGTLTKPKELGADASVEAAVGGIRLAAASAKVGSVFVVPVGVDLAESNALAANLASGLPTRPQAEEGLGVGPVPGAARAVVAPGTAGRSGVVVMVPPSLKRGDLVPVHHLMAATGWPMLGVLLVEKSRRRREQPTAETISVDERLADELFTDRDEAAFSTEPASTT